MKNGKNMLYGDNMKSCQICGNRMIKNGKRKLKYRGVVQNFCVWGVESKKLTLIFQK